MTDVTAAPDRKQNRSSEELQMRDLIETWGRERWPQARVVHELVTSQCRIDVAFIGRDHIAGVEIKSSKDTLDRLDKQMETFMDHLPEVWLAIAPKWVDPLREQFFSGPWSHADKLIVDVDREAGLPKVCHTWGTSARINRALTVQMLRMLWRGELESIARRQRLDCGKRPTMGLLIPLIARRLTGDEIVVEVCRELRARDAFWKSDPPIYDRVTLTDENQNV